MVTFYFSHSFCLFNLDFFCKIHLPPFCHLFIQTFTDISIDSWIFTLFFGFNLKLSFCILLFIPSYFKHANTVHRNINHYNAFCKILKIENYTRKKIEKNCGNTYQISCISESAEEPDKMQILGLPFLYLYICISIFSRNMMGYKNGILTSI